MQPLGVWNLLTSQRGEAAPTPNACSTSAGMQAPCVALHPPVQIGAACASSEPGTPALPRLRCANPAPSRAPAQPPLVTALLSGEDDAVGKTCVVQVVAQLIVGVHAQCQWEWALRILAGTWLCRVAMTTPPKPTSPQASWAGCFRARLAPMCLQEEFPRKSGLHICSNQTSKKRRRSQGIETHTEPAEWANRHRQKKPVSNQIISDQNFGLKRNIGRILKGWVASQHAQRAADPQLQALPCSPSTRAGVRQLQGRVAAHPIPPRGEGLQRHWAPHSRCLSGV